MRHRHIQEENVAASVNLTPLIDMVFILLIFFLVTASFTKESGIDVDRPTAQTAVRQEKGNLIIGVSETGEVWIENQQVDIRSIRAHVERLHAQNPEGTVIILADQKTHTGATVNVLDQVRLAGVTNVAIAGANFSTNLSVVGIVPDSNEMIQFPAFALNDGNYTFTATGDGVPVVRNLTVSGRFSYQIELVNGDATFVAGTNPTNNAPIYILDVRGATNPRLRLSSIEKPSLVFALNQPVRVNRLNSQEVEITLSGITATTEFQAGLAIDNQPCPDIVVPLSVVVRRGSPNFDIPVSEPKTGDCLKLFNGTIPRWP